MEVKKCQKLVIDTSAFFKCIPIWNYANEFYCVPEVIEEIRDRQTRQFIEALPVQVQKRNPQPASVKFVNEFTKKTGDFSSLSLVDTKVLALSYELEVESKGSSNHLRSEPIEQRTEQVVTSKGSAGFSNNIEGFYLSPGTIKGKGTKDAEEVSDMEDEDCEVEECKGTSGNENEVAIIDTETIAEEYSSESESDSGLEDDGGWITPSNISSLKNGGYVEETAEEMVQVACITGDYALQNTLKHIGLQVIGVDGKLINSLRTFILRCYSCYKLTNRMEKLFCPHCGNKTLKRVSVTLNPDGSQKIWISSKRVINTRGMKFSLPRPRGGKHAINPILVPDQREAQQRVSKLSKARNNPMHEDYDARAGMSPFLTRDVYSRSALLGIKSGTKAHRGMFYWEQRNPNESTKKGSRKKKRR